jgi:glycosyltransferase involved in cell wall biosynthesis
VSGPLVSIISPCYNHEEFIAQCIESVISQTYTNWEMIVVDDCSQDASFEIIRNYADADPRIRAIRHDSNYGASGLTQTYNEALNMSSGELIAILEGDDFWVSTKLEAQVPAFRDEGVVLVYADFDEVIDAEDLIKHHRVRVDQNSLKTEPPQNLTFFSRLGSFGANTVIVRKTALASIGGFASSKIPTVDFPTWLRLSLEGDFVCVPETLAFWRRHRDSMYFGNAEVVTEGVTEFLCQFARDNRRRIERHGLAAAGICSNAQRALHRQRTTARYFEGKYQLIFGNVREARASFLRAAVSAKTPMKHRAASILGVLASVTSKRVLLSSSNLRVLVSRRNR